MSASVLLEGFLSKRSPHMFKGWQKRYFTLTEDGILSYRKNKGDKEIKGSIRLDVTTLISEVEGKYLFIFILFIAKINKIKYLTTTTYLPY